MRKAWRASTLTALFAVLVLGGLLAFDRTCLELTVLSSNEKSAMLAQLANEWNRGATVDGRCVQVRVVRKPSGDAERALARGWDESADGPRPDVWSPAASSWTLLLRQHLAARNVPDVLPPRLPSVIQSPLVIAMPKPMAQALGWPDRSIGWSDLLALSREPQGWGRHGHPEWGALRLGKTNPTVSTSGLHALIAAYFEATGRLPAETDLSDPKVADFVRGLESSVVHYSETVATFFLNLREADRRGSALSYVSAIAVEEKEVWDYNRGVISSDVADPTPGLPPRVPLVAMYPPLGTLVADHPYAVLDVPWMTEEKRRVAAAFLRFLESAPTQERFASAAFRDHLGQPGAEISEANGLLAREPSLALRPPAPRVIDRIQRSWSDLRKRARVIIAIDESEAMGERLPSGETKLELVRRAALEAVGQLAVDDEVGLWSFATRAGTAPYRELVAVGRAGAQLGPLRGAIEQLSPVPGGRTALYATTRAAVRTLGSSIDPTRVNAVVVLTGGRNEDPGDQDRTALLDFLQSQREDSLVRVFTIGYGDKADEETLRLIARASRGAWYEATPGAIASVLRLVISDF